ncbi:hypothetical protein PCANC_27434 [Puccinia coronata f. sp. avenae]|uniref:Uncharacterized protein n=1 Tax=Puccinia coronata f. sp. avenae TaxID=200324 RepID=A0A2N5U8S5_9BASI|nr:hypothetical protein PCANC_27434 [Puccinia coronata f. sp. avenae]
MKSSCFPAKMQTCGQYVCLTTSGAIQNTKPCREGLWILATLIRVPSSTLIRVPRGLHKPLDLRGLRELGRTGVHGQHACPAGPHTEPSVLTPFVGVRHAGVCTPVWEGVQPRMPFF